MRIFVVTAFLFLLGCGSPSGDEWIIRTFSASVSVNELGAEWNSLDSLTRRNYLESGSATADFITAYSRKLLILQAISNDQYLFSLPVQSHRSAWIRNGSYSAYCDSLFNRAAEGLTGDTLGEHLDHVGILVWYTSEGEQAGPVEMHLLDLNLAAALDTLSPGNSCTVRGVNVTLDSLYRAPDSLLACSFQDSTEMLDYVRTSLSRSMVTRGVNELCSGVHESFHANTAALQMCLNDSTCYADSRVIATWNGGEFTSADFPGILRLSAVSGGFTPYSLEWALVNTENHAMMSCVELTYSTSCPADYAVLEVRAEALARREAADMLFHQRVLSEVAITDSMLQAEYSRLDSLPEIPETRIFASALVPEPSMGEIFQAVSGPVPDDSLGLQGLGRFLAPGERYLSRPVTESELPEDLAAVLFTLSPEDTGWLRPVRLYGEQAVMIRLDSVIPRHYPAFHEVRDDLHERLQAHLEEQLTMTWIMELEESYGLEINNGLLQSLPVDMSLWETL